MVGLVAVGPAAGAAQDEGASPASVVDTAMGWVDTPPPDWPSPPPASARSYLLVDADTGQVLAAREPDEPQVVASTVKLLTILTALQTLSPDETIVVGEEAAVGGAGASVDPGESWLVADLLDAILVRSGNDAALALAGAASDGDIDDFVARMDATARDLGLTDVHLTEPTGLADANRLSARALATIGRAALADPRIRESAGKAVVDLPDLGLQEARNLLIGAYDGATGLKTGFTDLAGYCLVASVERDGRELVAVILGAREDPARFEEAAALFDHAFEQLDSTSHDGLRARTVGRWDDLLPAGRTWAPDGVDVKVDLQGSPSQFDIELTADGEALGRASATVPAPRADGVGATLAEAAYRSMRHGHLARLWPDVTSTDTAPAGSG